MLKAMSFELGGCSFALDSKCVREVISHIDATPVTQQSAAVLGVLDIRAETIAAIDLHALLRLENTAEVTPQSCFVLVQLDNEAPVVALLVDRIKNSIKIGPNDLLPPPSVGGILRADYVEGFLVQGREATIVLSGSALLQRIGEGAFASGLNETCP